MSRTRGRWRVEVAGRLVGEEDLSAAAEGPGDGDALLLAAGELRGLVVAAVAEADASSSSRRGARGLDLGELERQQHVLPRGQVAEELERLEDEADLGRRRPAGWSSERSRIA